MRSQRQAAVPMRERKEVGCEAQPVRYPEEPTERRSDEQAAVGSARAGPRRDSRWTRRDACCRPPSERWGERPEPDSVAPSAQEREAASAVSTADLVTGLRAPNGTSGGGRASR